MKFKNIYILLTAIACILITIISMPTITKATIYLVEGKIEHIDNARIEYLENVDISIIEVSSNTRTVFHLDAIEVLPDMERHISQNFLPPLYEQKWYINQFNFQQAWYYAPLRTAKIAIIDTGISEQLLAKENIKIGKNFIDETALPIDDHGHGTGLASIVLDIIGPHPIEIIPIKAANHKGSLSISNITKAIDYAIEQNVDIINLSFGAKVPHKLEELAIQKAIEAGIVVISSSGNSGLEEYYYPAAYEGTISVGAIDERYNRASFSTYNNAVDFVAPGDNLLVLQHNVLDSHKTIQGTSFSSAYLSGMYGLFEALSFKYTTEQLTTLSKDLGPTGYDYEFGHGLLMPDETLQAIRGKVWETVITADSQKQWTIHFTHPVNPNLSLNSYIKIYNSDFIEQPVNIELQTGSSILATPVEPLQNGGYWLVIDQTLQSNNGRSLEEPGILKFIVQ